MDSGIPSDEYTRALDEEVESVKADEKVRKEFMLLSEAYAWEREMGGYVKVVSQIRKAIGEFTTKQMAKIFDVKETDCAETISIIQEHPDWDDEMVAEEVNWEA